MSHMHTTLDKRRLADLERDPNHVAAAIANFEAARATHPRLAAERAVLSTAAQALNVAHHPTFEPGVYPGLCGDLRAELDDDVLTDDQAESDATDYILSHAESMSDWLAKACDCKAGRNERDVSTVNPLQIINADPALLFAVVMTGSNDQVLRAAFQLRELAARDFAAEIKAHALRLLAEVA